MKKPKILLFDIETSPNLAYVWGKYQQDVISFSKEYELLSVAWKWLGEPKVHCATREGAKDDRNLCKILHSQLKQADVVIAHNGDAFDIKKSRARFLFHGLPPVPPIATVDTLKVARKYFKFNSNRLDDLAKYLGIGGKVKHSGFDLWFKCMNDDPKAWKKMIQYNKKDVLLLEDVYNKMRPYMETHPHLGLLQDFKGSCPKCAHKDCQKYGYRPNPQGLAQRWMCKGCSSYFLTRVTKDKEKAA
jgi:uncharacterized protein YprB with RNaseH-like and TPR domain